MPEIETFEAGASVSLEDFMGGPVKSAPTFHAGDNVSADDFFGGASPGQFQPETEEEKLGFLQRVGEDLQRRNDLGAEIQKSLDEGEIGYAESVLQSAGKVGAGAVLDFMGEATVSLGKGLNSLSGGLIGDAIKTTADLYTKTPVGKAAIAFLNSPIGQRGLEAGKAGVNEWFEFKEEHPRAAMNIEAVVNMGLVLAPAKGKPKAKAGSLGKTAEKLVSKADDQIAAKKGKFINELVRPKQTAGVRAEQVGRTVEKGALRSKVVELSPQEAKIAEFVKDVKGVSPKNTLQGNYTVISKEVAEEAAKLKGALAKNDVVIPKREFMKTLDDSLNRLHENPLIVGDAEKTAQRILVKMKKIVEGEKGTASGLLEARKKLDSWVRSQKSGAIFDPKNENALSIAIREIRNTTNDFIDLNATNVAVKQSLKKQSNLLRAMDNIAPKAADEGANAAIRLWQRTTKLLPLRGEFNQQMALLFGVGGLGASAAFAPFFTKAAGATLGTYAAGKFIMGPTVKKGLAHLLKATDDAIKATKDANLIAELRADRALLVEMIKSAEE